LSFTFKPALSNPFRFMTPTTGHPTFESLYVVL
jgi:hypothetical protein